MQLQGCTLPSNLFSCRPVTFSLISFPLWVLLPAKDSAGAAPLCERGHVSHPLPFCRVTSVFACFLPPSVTTLSLVLVSHLFLL